MKQGSLCACTKSSLLLKFVACIVEDYVRLQSLKRLKVLPFLPG